MSIVKYKNQSGVTYAYEQTSVYDPEKKQSRPKRKYLGRVDPETGESRYGKRSGDILGERVRKKAVTIESMKEMKQIQLVREWWGCCVMAKTPWWCDIITPIGLYRLRYGVFGVLQGRFWAGVGHPIKYCTRVNGVGEKASLGKQVLPTSGTCYLYTCKLVKVWRVTMRFKMHWICIECVSFVIYLYGYLPTHGWYL